MGALVGSAGDYSERHTSHQPAAHGEKYCFDPRRRGQTQAAERAEIAAVLALEPFERFVYVMSVLERYSDHDCSILLECARLEVTAARIRSVQQLGSVVRFPLMQQLNVGSEKPELQLAPR